MSSLTEREMAVLQLVVGGQSADVIAETLWRTNLGLLNQGDAVHVERSLRVAHLRDGGARRRRQHLPRPQRRIGEPYQGLRCRIPADDAATVGSETTYWPLAVRPRAEAGTKDVGACLVGVGRPMSAAGIGAVAVPGDFPDR